MFKKNRETTANLGDTYIMGNQLNSYLQECLEACNRCVQACNECFDVCCQSSQQEEFASCQKILRDCADICTLVSQLIARNSVNAKLMQVFVPTFVMLARKHVKNARTLVAKNVQKFADNVLTLAVKLAAVNEVKFP